MITVGYRITLSTKVLDHWAYTGELQMLIIFPGTLTQTKTTMPPKIICFMNSVTIIKMTFFLKIMFMFPIVYNLMKLSISYVNYISIIMCH